MSLFSATKDITVDALPEWQADARVVAARAWVAELEARAKDLYAELRTMQAKKNARPDLYENLSMDFPQGHPGHAVRLSYWQINDELKTAKSELMRVETTVQNEHAASGYQALARSWREELMPVLQQLVAALQDYEAVAQTVKERTGASLGGFGAVALDSKSLAEWIAGQTEKKFGG